MWAMMLAAWANPEVTEGSRPVRDLLVAAATRQAPMATCFKGSPTEILLMVHVQPDGRVTNTRFRTNDAPDPALTQCLVSETMRMRMPEREASEGNTVYKWTVSIAELGKPPPEEIIPKGELSVRGGLDHNEVEDVLGRYQSHFDYCFNKAKTRDPDLAGSFDVHMRVDAHGIVQTAVTKHLEMPHTQVSECIEGKSLRIRFSETSDGKPALVAVPHRFPRK